MKLKSNKTNNQSSLIDNQLEIPSTSVENFLQISSFMQNKPKVKYAKKNVNFFVTMRYEIMDNWLWGKQSQLKQKQTQFKANLAKG